jgi:3',5'-cyclic AMP phosphodiesterase CpdA
MIIAQITDLHIAEEGGYLRRFVDANAKLAAALEFLSTRHRQPDVVLATGDLVNDGRPAQYGLLRELLAGYDAPLYLVPGNHDDRETFRDAFGDLDWVPREGPIDYVVEDHQLRLVGLDTTEPDRHDGNLDVAQLEWLDRALAEAPDHPTLVFLHHPPSRPGCGCSTPSGSSVRLRSGKS